MQKASTDRKLRFIFAGTVLLLLGLAYVISGMLPAVQAPAERAYYVYASSYPVYALSSMILKDVPGIELKLLTQPSKRGYRDYMLSDWEYAILDTADITIVLGAGYEAFAPELGNGNSIFISLLSALPVKTLPAKAVIYENDQPEATPIPWTYLSLDGAMDICESLAANMCTADERYSSLYIANLKTAWDALGELKVKAESCHALEGVNVALLHEAFLYTADELRANVVYAVTSDDAETLAVNDVSSIASEMKRQGVQAILADDNIDPTLAEAFANAGFHVIKLELMTDMDANFDTDGFFTAYTNNLNSCEESINASCDDIH